jgi:hypothetical protein
MLERAAAIAEQRAGYYADHGRLAEAKSERHVAEVAHDAAERARRANSTCDLPSAPDVRASSPARPDLLPTTVVRGSSPVTAIKQR